MVQKTQVRSCAMYNLSEYSWNHSDMASKSTNFNAYTGDNVTFKFLMYKTEFEGEIELQPHQIVTTEF